MDGLLSSTQQAVHSI